MKPLRRNQKDRMWLGEGQICQIPGTRQGHCGCQPSSLTVTAALWQGLPSQHREASKSKTFCNDRQTGGQDEALYTGSLQGLRAQLPSERVPHRTGSHSRAVTPCPHYQDTAPETDWRTITSKIAIFNHNVSLFLLIFRRQS